MTWDAAALRRRAHAGRCNFSRGSLGVVLLRAKTEQEVEHCPRCDVRKGRQGYIHCNLLTPITITVHELVFIITVSLFPTEAAEARKPPHHPRSFPGLLQSPLISLHI